MEKIKCEDFLQKLKIICYKSRLVVLELVRSTDNEFTTDNEVTDNVVDKDDDFS